MAEHLRLQPERAGGTLFVHYTYTGAWGQYGYWGALDQNDSPLDGDGAHKYRAITRWAESHR